jgi:hypothetical protein
MPSWSCAGAGGLDQLPGRGHRLVANRHRASAQVTVAVLLYRAVTYLPPIPLGAVACLTWRHAPAFIHAKPAAAGQPAGMSPSGPDPATEERTAISPQPAHQAETVGYRGRAEF